MTGGYLGMACATLDAVLVCASPRGNVGHAFLGEELVEQANSFACKFPEKSAICRKNIVFL